MAFFANPSYAPLKQTVRTYEHIVLHHLSDHFAALGAYGMVLGQVP